MWVRAGRETSAAVQIDGTEVAHMGSRATVVDLTDAWEVDLHGLGRLGAETTSPTEGAETR